jgi:tripartite ATP-independent transporter DctP family solute receptor
VAALGFGALFASDTQLASADGEVTVRVATVAPEGTPWEKQLRAFKKHAEEKSGGRIKVKMFMGGSLGGEKALVRRTAQGSLEVFGGSAGAMGSLVQELNVIEAPFLFDSFEQADKVFDGPTKDLVKQILDKRGFVFAQWAENGFRSWFSKDKPIKTPADLKGLRMRSQESPVHINTYKAFGATPVPIDITNVLTSLQTGVVDGFDNTPLYAFAASWYQAVKHATMSRHCYQPGVVVMSKRWYATLPPDLQKVLADTPTKIQTEGRNGVRSMDPILVENLKRAGVTVHEPSAAEMEPFKKATSKIADEFANKTGPDAKALLKSIRAHL